MHLIVNDIEQFSYLFNIFYSEPFKITQTIQESPIIVDGGANIGMTSIYFHSRFPKATIYAFEPSPANIELLTHNLSNIQCSHIQQKALWDESKELIFNISECSRYNSAFNQEKTTRPVPVEAVRLSDWLETNRIRKIDVLKLNVEGAEIKAIRGLGNRIADVGLIIGEFHPQFVTNEELFEELHKIKFVLVKMVKTGKITSIFEAYNPNFYK
jgi:FkbM family methyltransferase